jgi:hypothetical protein
MMTRLLLIVAVILGLSTTTASAVDLKNIRLRYGPMGAVRESKLVLPGDLIFMSYDIENLTLDKAGKASYVTILELLDAQDKVIYDSKTPMEVLPQLGGTRMPGNLHLIMGPKQAPGKYAIRLTVHDKIGKDAKAFKYSFDLSSPVFGMVGVLAPAIGFPGQMYRTELNFVNSGLDAKKNPDLNVNIRILDQAGKAVVPTVEFKFPRDLPPNVELDKENLIPLTYPVYLNRVGRFTMEISAQDKNSKKETKLSYPFTVIDIDGK